VCRLRSRYRSVEIRNRFAAPALAVFFSLLFDGCADSCFLFVSNSGTGKIVVAAGSGDASCRTTKGTGTAQFRIGGLENSTETLGPQHIFLMLDGVVGHEDATASLDSPGWQELAPDLAEHPVQVDLLAKVDGSNVFPASVHTRVNSGVYRQLGLRLLSSPASRDAVSPRDDVATTEKNVCGEAGWHCVVFTDGGVQSIALPPERNVEGNANPVLRISSQQIAGNPIVVLPDAVRTYAIRFDLRSSVILSRNNAILVRPIFSVLPE
jgi:hypothetical protein